MFDVLLWFDRLVDELSKLRTIKTICWAAKKNKAQLKLSETTQKRENLKQSSLLLDSEMASLQRVCSHLHATPLNRVIHGHFQLKKISTHLQFNTF